MSEEKVFPTIKDLRKANELLNNSGAKERVVVYKKDGKLITASVDEHGNVKILDMQEC